MPRIATLLSVLALVLSVAALAFVGQAEGVSAPTADGIDEARLRDIARRLDLLEEGHSRPRLAPGDPSSLFATIDDRLRALEERESAAPATTGARAGSAAGEKAAAAAKAREPSVPVERLQTDDLVAGARALARKGVRDLAEPYWRELIQRGTSDSLLLEANLEIGYAEREAGDHDAAERSFLEVMRIAGPDSAKGQHANFQIAWCDRFRGDLRSARDRMAATAQSRYTGRDLAGHANLNVAQLSLELNDQDRAREAIAEMRATFGGSKRPLDVWFVERADEMLESLDGEGDGR